MVGTLAFWSRRRIEQDHRGIKQRYYPLRSFENLAAAARFRVGFKEQRQDFHAQSRSGGPASSTERRHRFREC